MPRNKWAGWFKQDGEKKEMTFRNVKTKEETITGEGEDDNGDFTLEGTISGRDVEFIKNYADVSIKYNGSISKDHMKMWGHWDINDGETVGSFKLKAIIDKSAPKFKLEEGDILWKRKGEWTVVGNDVYQIQHHLKHVYIISNEDRLVYKWVYGDAFNWNCIS